MQFEVGIAMWVVERPDRDGVVLRAPARHPCASEDRKRVDQAVRRVGHQIQGVIEDLERGVLPGNHDPPPWKRADVFDGRCRPLHRRELEALVHLRGHRGHIPHADDAVGIPAGQAPAGQRLEGRDDRLVAVEGTHFQMNTLADVPHMDCRVAGQPESQAAGGQRRRRQADHGRLRHAERGRWQPPRHVPDLYRAFRVGAHQAP
mmetsp:Transcript_47856/g.129122  ORF Transcript_47856/g.129122 Transcript_47856/m.129122 type:complete len:204 (+) Transcript_47856:879-1490(+)